MKCKVCGTIQDKPPHYSYKQWEERIYCSKKCRGIDLKPTGFTHWKGGKTFFDGYWWIYNPNHPKAVKQYVKQSILILEQKLGRPLEKNEIPHHIDGDKTHDDPANLIAMDNIEHSRLHALLSKLGHDKKTYRQRDSLGRFRGVNNEL